MSALDTVGAARRRWGVVKGRAGARGGGGVSLGVEILE